MLLEVYVEQISDDETQTRVLLLLRLDGEVNVDGRETSTK